MKINKYQDMSKRTLPKEDLQSNSVNYALGLIGESGEVSEIIKKWVFHGHDLDRCKLKNELGDVLHYVAGLATMNGFTLKDIAQGNLTKLATRYPNGFSVEDSKKRVDKN